MDVSDASITNTMEKKIIKVGKWGTPKKNYKKSSSTSLSSISFQKISYYKMRQNIIKLKNILMNAIRLSKS
jgi:hypothetical protein